MTAVFLGGIRFGCGRKEYPYQSSWDILLCTTELICIHNTIYTQILTGTRCQRIEFLNKSKKVLF